VKFARRQGLNEPGGGRKPGGDYRSGIGRHGDFDNSAARSIPLRLAGFAAAIITGRIGAAGSLARPRLSLPALEIFAELRRKPSLTFRARILVALLLVLRHRHAL
jgi:hypothetical protein